MNPSRRTLLTGGGVLVAGIAASAAGLIATERWVVEAARHAPVGADLFVLRTSALPARVLEQALWREARPTRLTTHTLKGLSGADFAPLRNALAVAAGHRLFAVVDDAQAVVVEAVLSRSILIRRPLDLGAINLGLGRRGLILLTGTIQE